MDSAVKTVRRLLQALQRLENKRVRGPSRHMEALEKIASIFSNATGELPQTDSPVSQTSSTPTGPVELQAAPRISQHTTRQRQEGMFPRATRVIPPIIEDARMTDSSEMSRRQDIQRVTIKMCLLQMVPIPIVVG